MRKDLVGNCLGHLDAVIQGHTVVAVAGELREVLDALRGILVEELDLDCPLTRRHDRPRHGRDATRSGLSEGHGASWPAKTKQG